MGGDRDCAVKAAAATDVAAALKHLVTGTNLQDKDFGRVWPRVAVMPGRVLVHSSSSRRVAWIPVVRDVVPVGQVLQDGVAAAHRSSQNKSHDVENKTDTEST